MASWPTKDPDEVLDYQVDWTNRLQVGETISTCDFSVVSGAVTINSEGNVGALATVWLSGGTAGELCSILNRITTSAGRTYDQTVKLRIRTK